MNLRFLASFLLICAIVLYFTKRSEKAQESIEKAFWDKERKSNSIRKKSLDTLQYISIPEEILQMQPLSLTEEIQGYLHDLQDLSQLKIVNLTGISNTDLKLTYGTANITILSEYDSHYTNMVTILQKLAEHLLANGDKTLAEQVLDFAVSTGTDVSRSYYLLASIYQESGQPEKIDALIQSASHLHSMMSNTIVRHLKEMRSKIAS